MILLDAIDEAVEAFRRGDFVVVVDDADPGTSGDLVLAADAVTAEKMAWMVRHTSGRICTPMTDHHADRLHLPLVATAPGDAHHRAFTISVDLVGPDGVGPSTDDRAATVAALADPTRSPREFSRPGHVFPLRARPGGVLQRAGHTEAAVDLCRLAGRTEIGVSSEMTDGDGAPLRLAGCREFADRWGLRLVSIADLIRHRRRGERLVEHFAAARVPTAFGEFTAHAYRSLLDGEEHLAFVMGDVAGGAPPLVRVHSECLTGDILGSLRCDCGPQLQTALQKIAADGRGALVYLRGHEGRGIGIGHKLRAYALQDDGMDTVEANEAQGLPADSREYGVGANILVDLGITAMRLMTNNPTKLLALEGYDLEVTERVPIEIVSNPENVRYLQTKRDRMGHALLADDA